MSYFEKRIYQERALNFIKKCKKEGKHALLELDCGLGKRIITYLLAKKLFADKKILIILHSSASLSETLNFFREHIDERELGWLSSSIPHQFRKRILNEKRIVLTTPTIIANLLRRYPTILKDVDIIVINEADKIVKRIGRTNHVLIYPWNQIIPKIRNEKFIIGMSGTFRDEATLIGRKKIYSIDDLTILRSILNDANVLYMENILEEAKEYINVTHIHLEPIVDQKMIEILRKIELHLKRLMSPIKKQNADVKLKDILIAPEKFDIDEDTLKEIRNLTLLRKFLVAMPINSVKKYFLADKAFKKYYVDVIKIKENEKIRKVVKHLTENQEKVAVLSSYKETIKLIQKELERRKISSRILTGEVRKKEEILNEFSKRDDIRALLISPVGERDLDLTMISKLYILDVINTPKTMYQRMKRGRESDVYIFFFKDTFEERKVKRLLKNIKTKYPWSIEIVNF